MKFNPSLQHVLKNHLSRYSLVIATAKRYFNRKARQSRFAGNCRRESKNNRA